MVALLAFAWVPLTSHCSLEAVPGFEFLRCSTDAPTSSEGGDPCQDNGCCAVESAQYHPPRQHDIARAVVVAIPPKTPRAVVEPSLPQEVSLGLLTAAPPELSRSWQFFSRTALPVRAPSPAS